MDSKNTDLQMEEVKKKAPELLAEMYHNRQKTGKGSVYEITEECKLKKLEKPMRKPRPVEEICAKMIGFLRNDCTPSSYIDVTEMLEAFEEILASYHQTIDDAVAGLTALSEEEALFFGENSDERSDGAINAYNKSIDVIRKVGKCHG